MPAASAPHTIHGTIKLTDNSGEGWSGGRHCQNVPSDIDSTYSNVKTGTLVTVRDASGKIIGIGHLGVGTAQPYDPSSPTTMVGYDAQNHCELPFTVTVPRTSFYQVDVSGLSGHATFSLHQLDMNGWLVDLTG